MKNRLPLLLALSLTGLGCNAGATPASRIGTSQPEAERPYLQCVPYARQVTGIQIFGDAHTWWSQASGRYARGNRPKVGAVMNFRPYGGSQLGHVAAVSRVVDPRTVLVRHANWSPIDGRRGQIEDNVRVVDVSPDNDWSEVRVWYAPLGALGTTHWPLYGFIYNEAPGRTALGRATLGRATPGDSKGPRESAQPAIRLSAIADSDPIGMIIQRANRR